ncbi:MAG: acetyl-CoA C-acyltransferase [Dehalococcoidia bacterium]|nr:acetyl-CoA C-acyltransferase [Dehalococcoidia bacterium]
MPEAVIASAARTPIGTFSGAFSDVSATQLGAIAIAEALRRAGVAAEDVDEVVMGNVLQAGLGMNPTRQAAIAAGLPVEVPATTVNKVCGSGLKTVALAAAAVMLGDAECVVAGGMENMTRSPFLLPEGRTGHKMGHTQLLDSMINDGLWCALEDCHMGVTAENVRAQYEITRAEQDDFAYSSQQRALKAIEHGRFDDEIVPVEIPGRKGDVRVVNRDEHPRADTTLESLAKLRAAFKPEGSVTAGNSSGINDGAAAVVVMSKEKADRLGVTPMATIKGYTSAGVEPRVMGIGPIPAVKKVLARTGIDARDIDLFEVNEAFAAQSIAVLRDLDLDSERVNPNGGAIALGHPIGASGARVLTTLLYEMKRRHAHRGLATLCIGGGQGIAMVIENGA